MSDFYLVYATFTDDRRPGWGHACATEGEAVAKARDFLAGSAMRVWVVASPGDTPLFDSDSGLDLLRVRPFSTPIRGRLSELASLQARQAGPKHHGPYPPGYVR